SLFVEACEVGKVIQAALDACPGKDTVFDEAAEGLIFRALDKMIRLDDKALSQAKQFIYACFKSEANNSSHLFYNHLELRKAYNVAYKMVDVWRLKDKEKDNLLQIFEWERLAAPSNDKMVMPPLEPHTAFMGL